MKRTRMQYTILLGVNFGRQDKEKKRTTHDRNVMSQVIKFCQFDANSNLYCFDYVIVYDIYCLASLKFAVHQKIVQFINSRFELTLRRRSFIRRSLTSFIDKTTRFRIILDLIH